MVGGGEQEPVLKSKMKAVVMGVQLSAMEADELESSLPAAHGAELRALDPRNRIALSSARAKHCEEVVKRLREAGGGLPACFLVCFALEGGLVVGPLCRTVCSKRSTFCGGRCELRPHRTAPFRPVSPSSVSQRLIKHHFR